MTNSTSPRGHFDATQAAASAERLWESEVLPELERYIRIPNKSPAYDAAWRESGHMDRAVAQLSEWSLRQPIPGLSLEVVRLEGRTPLLFMEIPGTASGTVLLYGHLDKQPEFTGWREGTGPWTPVRVGDRLYGRGGADDGYSTFAALGALRLLQEQGVPHARCVVVIEACEESGSYDLPAYMERLAPRIGKVDLVVCLDSGCGNYEQLWMTTSLRGLLAAELKVEVLTEGVHSGDASGIVPSSFRIARQLLSRIEDEHTGRVLLPELQISPPPERIAQARAVADVLGSEVYDKFPWQDAMRPMSSDLVELVLNRTWRPTLSIIGADGIPTLENAGSVLRPHTSLKLSVRVPPRIDMAAAAVALQKRLASDPPYGARVTVTVDKASAGWDAPPLEPWLSAAVHAASMGFFGKPAMAMGEGGTIPFMGMLGEKFPEAQFLITGLLGPHSNAHGPNEFLHIPTGKRLTGCVASVLAAHAAR